MERSGRSARRTPALWLHFILADVRTRDWIAACERLLQEEIAARIGEATNRNIYFLSIVTALLLPISFITGIFGMNVGGLPFLDSPGGFAWTLLLMGATLMATIILLRWRRLL